MLSALKGDMVSRLIRAWMGDQKEVGMSGGVVQ